MIVIMTWEAMTEQVVEESLPAMFKDGDEINPWVGKFKFAGQWERAVSPIVISLKKNCTIVLMDRESSFNAI